MDFARNNLPPGKRVFLIYTCGSNTTDYTRKVKRIVRDKSCSLLGTYCLRGYDTFGPFKLFGGIAKGHPDEKDINGAVELFKRLVENV